MNTACSNFFLTVVAHLQCVLDETNSGDIILHNHISPKEITNLEPIAGKIGLESIMIRLIPDSQQIVNSVQWCTSFVHAIDSVYKARYQNNVVAIKYFRPYFIGFEWSRLRTEVAILR